MAEMLQSLPVLAVYLVANLFLERYGGHKLSHVKGWDEIIMIFLARFVYPQLLSSFEASPRKHCCFCEMVHGQFGYACPKVPEANEMEALLCVWI